MGLTSTAVLAVVAALAVALFAATVRLWPRLARPGAAAVSGRIGLLATQLTLFAAVGLAANNAFLLYGSWADLFGQKQELGVVTDDAGGEARAGGSRHLARVGTQHPDVPGGRVPSVGGRIDEAVAESYRVGEKARDRGVIGNSTGGYCALKVGLRHPDRYAASAGLSAYYRAAEDPTTGDLFHGRQELRDRADLMWALENRPPSGGSFLVTTSRRGEGNLGSTMEFIEKVKAPAKVSSIVLDSGGHNFTTWRREIPPALEWLSARLGED